MCVMFVAFQHILMITDSGKSLQMVVIGICWSTNRKIPQAGTDMSLSIAFQSCYFNIQGNGFWFCFRTLYCTKFAQSLYKVHFANRTNKSGYFSTNCLYWNTSLKNGEDVQVNIRRLLSSIIKPD